MEEIWRNSWKWCDFRWPHLQLFLKKPNYMNRVCILVYWVYWLKKTFKPSIGISLPCWWGEGFLGVFTQDLPLACFGSQQKVLKVLSCWGTWPRMIQSIQVGSARGARGRVVVLLLLLLLLLRLVCLKRSIFFVVAVACSLRFIGWSLSCFTLFFLWHFCL